MDNHFNGRLNGGDQLQSQTSMVKAIVLAIIGMLLGAATYIIAVGFFEWSTAWLSGLAIGGGISLGWHLGKGPKGKGRQLWIVMLSIVGSVIGVWVGFGIYYYSHGIGGGSFMNAIGIVGDFLVDDFENVIRDFVSFFGDDGFVIRHLSMLMVIAVSTAWKEWGKGEEVLESDNVLDGIPTDDENTPSEVNDDIPTLDL